MAPNQGSGEAGANGHGNLQKATKRSRWATRKLTVKSSSLKRLSLVGRKHTRTTSSEKKRTSGGSGGSDFLQQPEGTTTTQPGDGDANSTTGSHDGAEPRTLYFNLALPDALKDDSGLPLQTFTRNKIRTAKYTPLSFVPKNLWFQFHNIANIFFLFLVILVV